MSTSVTTVDKPAELAGYSLNDPERWADLPGFEGLYRVSTVGNVMSRQARRNAPIAAWRPMSGYCDTKGYRRCVLTKDGQRTDAKIHRLVALCFLPNPANKAHVNHKNGVKHDNRVENLEWCTNAENMRHAFATGLNSNVGSRNPRAKIGPQDVARIRQLAASGVHYRDIAAQYPINAATTNKIITGKLWPAAA